jgi:ribonuclease HI
MFQYCHDDLSELRADAVIIEVDCVCTTSGGQWSSLESAFPDVVAAYRKAFAEGDIEPGRVLRIARTDQSPAHAFLFPSRVHPNGEVRAEYIEKAVDDLTEQVIRSGAKSIAMGRMGGDRGSTWSAIKRRLLYSFARVPDIKLIGMLPRQMIDTPVTIFTDGGAEPNPGRGGYGVVLRFGDHSKELSDGFRLTSNNRMELMAAIVGLEALKQPCRVHLHSDSRYVVDMVNGGSLFRIAAKNWANSKAKNLNLWKRFLKAFLVHEVDMVWVKGHAGIDDNERCDQLATIAMKQKQLKEDDGYDQRTIATVSKPTAPTETQSHSVEGKRPPKPKKVGDPCRHCRSPLVRREPKKHKADAAYYFAWYLYCEHCRRIYHVEEAKVTRGTGKS